MIALAFLDHSVMARIDGSSQCSSLKAEERKQSDAIEDFLAVPFRGLLTSKGSGTRKQSQQDEASLSNGMGIIARCGGRNGEISY